MASIRVTQGMQYLQALSSLHRNYGRLFENQSAIGSGRRIQTASDDPTGAARILDYARRAGDLGAYRNSISAAVAALDGASSELQGIADVFHRARERVVQALNGTLADADRVAIANELDEHLNSMLNFANAQGGRGFVFAGSRTDVAPFMRVTGADGIERVRYAGDDLTSHVDVGPGISEPSNIPGSRLIDLGSRGPTSYFGTTGARAGSGTDSGIGRARLTVAHTITGFGPNPGALQDPASGVRGGASGTAQDTILGFGHVLNVTIDAAGTSGTVNLNGGPTLNFTAAAAADLRVTGPNGEIVYLDLTQVQGGFSGQVQLNSYGTLSLDGGQTVTPINFGATGQRIVSPVDGSVTFIDATGITRTGTEELTYGGTLDLFNSILAIRDLLKTTGSREQITAALGEARKRLDDLDRGENAILREIAVSSSISERLSRIDQRMADLGITIESRRSEIEDVDLTTVLTDLQENEAVYQSSLLITARLSRISLANFLG